MKSARENMIISAFKRGWVLGGFCSTHGYGVLRIHTSVSCKNQVYGQVKPATHAKPSIPGSKLNKGWDDGFTLWGRTEKLYDNLDTFLTQSSAFNSIPSSSPTVSNLDTTIADTRSRVIYLTKGTYCQNIEPTAPNIQVGTASGQRQASSATCEIGLSNIPVRKGHVMPGFAHSLVVIGVLCYTSYTVTFTKHLVTVYGPYGNTILDG